MAKSTAKDPTCDLCGRMKNDHGDLRQRVKKGSPSLYICSSSKCWTQAAADGYGSPSDSSGVGAQG